MPLCPCLAEDLWNGRHGPDDDYRLALYSSAAPEEYSDTGEISARGYPSGGLVLKDRQVSEGGELSFDGPSIAVTTVRGVTHALLYNRTSGCAMARYALPEPLSATNGPLRITERIRLPLG